MRWKRLSGGRTISSWLASSPILKPDCYPRDCAMSPFLQRIGPADGLRAALSTAVAFSRRLDQYGDTQARRCVDTALTKY